MKRALAFIVLFSLVGFATLAQISGKWDFTLSLGWRDVTVSYPGTTITVPGGTFPVDQGFVEIPDQQLIINIEGQKIPVVVPGGSYPVGPWDITIPGDTFNVSQGFVTIPDKTITVQLGDTTCEVTVPSVTVPVGPWEVTIEGGTYPVTQGTVTIPDMTIPVQLGDTTCEVTVPAISVPVEVPNVEQKEVDVLLFAADKTIEVEPPKAYYLYTGEVEYEYYVYQTPSGTLIDFGTGTLDLEAAGLADEDVVPFTDWNWTLLCWEDIAKVMLPAATDVNLYPEPGKHFQIDFPEFEVKVKCSDLKEPWMLEVLGREGQGFDQNNNIVVIKLKPHYLHLSVDEFTTVKIPAEVNWAYTPEPFEEQHWLFVKIPPTEFIVHWPDWPRCCTAEEPRPWVEVVWEGYDTAVYQYVGDETELEAIKDDVEAQGEDVLDKIGFGFLDTVPETFYVNTDGEIVIEQGAIEGTFLLGSFAYGTTTVYVNIPDRPAYGTCNGQSFQLTIPGGIFPVSDQYVTIPDRTITIPADEVVIPERTATGTCAGQSFEIVVPGGTYQVSDQTVTIPDVTIHIPAKNVVIPDKTIIVEVAGQEIMVTIPGGKYEVSDQYVTIPDRTITIPAWSQTIERVPDLSIETVLTLTYTFGAFDVTSISKFTDDGFVSQKFEISGEFGPVSLSGYMEFDPSVPAYVKSWLEGTLDFAGISLTGKVTHEPNEMHYYLTAEVDPVTVKLSFVDYCTGIQFDNVLVSLDDFSLCCGITYDASLYFTKEGFEYVKFAVDSLFDLCCGISFGAGVEFGLDYKKLSLDVNWAGIEGCVTVYGDVQWEEELNKVAGLDIYGWKIVCELAECTKLEILTALDPSYKEFEDIFEGDEFEYIKASFCGPGCCGGNWTFDSTIFFQPSGTLFGITRVKLNFTFPVMDNLTVKLGGEVPENSFSFGWSLTF